MARPERAERGRESARAATPTRIPPSKRRSAPAAGPDARATPQFDRAIASLSAHDHACIIYSTTAELYEAIIPFIQEGLARGERCVYVTDDQSGHDIVAALRAAGIDTADAEARRQLVLLTQRDAYLRDGAFDPDRMIALLAESTTNAQKDGFSGLRVTGEMTWALQGLTDIAMLLEYEAKLNGFFPVHDCLAICQYDRRRFSAEVIRDVIRTHPVIISGHTVCRNPYYVPPREFLSAESAEHEVDRLLRQLVDRERVEESLRESRNWLSAVLDNAPIAMVVVDETGRVCHANRAAAALADQPAEEMVGSLLGNAIRCLNAIREPRGCGNSDACQSCEVRKAVQSTIATGVLHRNFKASLPLGKVAGAAHTDVVVSATPLDLSGRRMVLASIDDVSDTVRAETSLKTFLDALPESALLTSADGQVIEANNEVLHRLGVTRETMLRHSLFELIPEQVRATRLEATRRVIESGKPTRFVDWRNGRCIDNVVAPVRNSDGSVDRLAMLGLDVTERVLAEESLRRSEREKALILSSTAELFAMYDRELHVQWANKPFCEAVGLSEEQLRGRHCYGLWAGCDAPCPACPVKMAIETGESHETEHTTPDGRIWFLRGRPVFNDVGDVIGAVEFAQEVTRLRSAEAALRESEERFRGIVENASDIIYTLAPDGRFTYVGSNVRELLGYEPEEAMGRGYVDFVHPDNLAECDAVFERAMSKGEPVKNLTYQIRHKDGSWRWHTSNGALLKASEGRETVYIGIARDVTEQRLAEAELRESETNFRDLFESVPDMVIVCTPEGRILFFNASVPDTLGYSPNELTSMRLLELHPADKREEAEAIFAAMLRGERGTCPLPLARRDGTLVPVETRVWLGRWNGEDCVYGFCKNLTAEVEAQQRFERLFANNPAAMALSCVPDRRFIDVNEAFLNITGYSRGEVIGKTSAELGLFHAPEHQTVVANMLESDGRIINQGLQVRCKNGTVRHGLFSGEVIRNQGRRYLLTVMVDLTAQHDAEEKLRESEQRMILALRGAELGTWDWNIETGEATFDDRWAEMLGYTREEVRRHVDEWETRVHPDDLSFVKAALDAHLNGETESYESEHRLRHKSGEWVWILDKGRIIERDADGRPLRACGTHLDITERKRAEEAFREQEALLRSVERMAKVGGWELDAETLKVSWTEEVYRIHDVPLGDMPDLKGALDFYHPEDRIRLSTAIQVALEEGRPYDLVLRFTTAKGRNRWVRTVCKPVMANGRTVKLAGTFKDITERKEAEEALREALLWRESAIRAGNVGIWDWDLKSDKVVYSTEWKRQIGYSDEEIGTGFHEWETRVHPDDLGPVKQYLGDCIAQRRLQWETQFRFRHKNGSYRWILAQAALFSDEQGEPIRALGTHVDITEQKRAQEALQQNEAMYRTLVNGLPDIVKRFDREGRHLFTSENVVETMGVPADQCLGKTHRELGLPEELCQKLESAIRETFDSGVPLETELAMGGAQGQETYNWRLVPERDGEGRVQSVLSISRDITEHRRAQREYETLFAQMLNGFALHEIICDDNGRPIDYRFLAANPAFETMTGLRAADIIGKTVLEVLPSTEKSWIETYGRVALGGEPVRFGNYSEELQKNFVVTAFQPAPRQFACIFEDVTDLKRAEAERRELETQLRQSQKLEAMGQLASGVAHDFNNLLTAISGYAELLRQSIPEGTTAEHAVDGIEEATLQAAGVTRSLLTFSSKVHTKKRRVDLRTLVEKTTLLLRRMMPASISIETDPPHRPAVWLSADENQLQQVIMNLALNARDAMPDGGVLRIGVSESADQRRVRSPSKTRQAGTSRTPAAKLVVSDTGTGMSPETLKRVFEPFFTTKARGQGTGLGLAIVHGIVSEHGGSVEIDTAVAKGTTITVSLPIEAAEAEGRQEARPVPLEQARGELVLLAEDNWNVRSIVGTVLNNSGFRVIAASDGEAFLNGFKANTAEIRLLILDVDLPKRNGWDCLRDIRESGCSVPAIIITGGVDTRFESDLDKHTVLLRKPFGMPELQRLATELATGRGVREAST